MVRTQRSSEPRFRPSWPSRFTIGRTPNRNTIWTIWRRESRLWTWSFAADGVPAHLAGGLGVPGWVLVRQADGWRWLAGENSTEDSTPWYSSIRLFRSGMPAGAIKPIAILRDELLKQMAIPAEENGMRSIGSPHWNLNSTPERAS